MSAIPMARRPLCRTCHRLILKPRPGQPAHCKLIRFWTPEKPGSDQPRGHRWLKRFTTSEKADQHARAAEAAAYINGQQDGCTAHIEVTP